MPNTRNKRSPLLPYYLEVLRTLRKIVNAQELEAERHKLGLEAEIDAARNVHQTAGINQARPGVQQNDEINQPRQSANDSRGSAESENGSQDDTVTSPPVANTERETRIAKQIAIDGENAVWVTTTPTLITKASFSFPAKVWWAIVWAQLRSTANDNTLSLSHASLVACLMVGYPVNLGRIIVTEMRDRALNERATLLFACLIRKLCRQADNPPNRLVDRWCDAFRLIQVSKIKDVANHLFGVKSAAASILAVVPHVPIDIPPADRGPTQGDSSQPSSSDAPPPPASTSQAPGTFVTIPMFFLEKLVADQHQTRTLVNQIVNRMPQLIETKVLAAKKEIKDKMRNELSVLKDIMDGLENLVQDRFHAADLADTEEFKAQLAEMHTEIAKLDEKAVQVPTPVMPESFMQMLTQEPSTQSLDQFWGISLRENSIRERKKLENMMRRHLMT
uniref:Putative plant transposon protein domain-containing protein n=1 Tax=Solanum tuberosum TaxID=4113 RepID=M1DKB4_SOLTU